MKTSKVVWAISLVAAVGFSLSGYAAPNGLDLKPRYSSTVSRASLQQRLRELRREIKTLKRQAEKLFLLGDPINAGRVMDEVAGLQLEVWRIEARLHPQECNPANTQIKMVIENNSAYSIAIYVVNSDGMGELLGTVPSAKRGTLNWTLAQIKNHIGNAKSGKMAFLATIEGKAVWLNGTYSVANLPQKRPCQRTLTWQLFDRHFPKPPARYCVFGVDNAGPNLYVGVDEVLSQLHPCDFLNGGHDCTSPVKYRCLSQIFTKYEDAQREFCSMVQQHVYWQLYAPCQERYMVGGSWFWGCNSTVVDAINKYCPQYK